MKPVLAANWHDRPEIMARALRSCAAHVSGVCISIDPAFPQDGDFIRDECLRLGLSGHVYETPRTSGGQIRTEVMRQGEIFARRIGAAYVVNLDADDELAFDDGFAWPTDGAPVYWFEEHHGAASYPFKRLFKVGLGWKWYGPIHEEPYCATVPIDAPAPVAKGVRYIKHVDGERETDAERYGAHAEICRKWIEEHPQDHRWAFYLAQSLRCAGKVQEAVAAYEAFLARDDGSPSHRYLAALAVVEILAGHGAKATDLLLLMHQLAETAPERAEPWRMVERLARKVADSLPVPVGAVMLDKSAYGRWK